MKKLILPFVASAFLAACTSDDLGQTVQGDKFGGQVTLTSEPFTFEDGMTRTVLTNTGSSIEFAWKDGEAIGIFPIAPTTNYQAKQVLNVSGAATNASFDGAGWALLKGNTYAAYSPYVNKMADYNAVPMDMTGQAQDGNGSLAHIGGKYDYMCASASIPSDGNVNFSFSHVGCIIMLELTMPEAGTWTEASLTSADEVFTTSATMNVSTGAVASASKSGSISLALQNISTTEANQKITLYMSALPCTTGDLTVKVKSSDNKEYNANLATKTFVAGHAYRWTANMIPQPFVQSGTIGGYAYVDLGLSVKWANMNVGATKATDYGTYFAWGEVTGCQQNSNGSCVAATMDGYPSSWTGGTNSNYVKGNSKSTYSWADYKWCQGTQNSLVKYCKSSSYGTVDNKITLESSDDAATVNWSDDWRMPTHAELDELYNNCYWLYTSDYKDSGIAGYIVYKVKNASDKGVKVTSVDTPLSGYSLVDTHIFLPLAGICIDNKIFNADDEFNFWTSSLMENNSRNAWFISFQSDYYYGACSNTDRFYGFSVRAVVTTNKGVTPAIGI